MKLYISPTCCALMRRQKTIVITEYSEGVGKPVWELLSDDKVYNRIPDLKPEDWIAPPKFCPYCGVALPAIERRPDVYAPIAVDDDGHCGTCGERVRGCICLPPWGMWQPKGGDDIDVNLLWLKHRQETSERLFNKEDSKYWTFAKARPHLYTKVLAFFEGHIGKTEAWYVTPNTPLFGGVRPCDMREEKLRKVVETALAENIR